MKGLLSQRRRIGRKLQKGKLQDMSPFRSSSPISAIFVATYRSKIAPAVLFSKSIWLSTADMVSKPALIKPSLPTSLQSFSGAIVRIIWWTASAMMKVRESWSRVEHNQYWLKFAVALRKIFLGFFFSVESHTLTQVPFPGLAFRQILENTTGTKQLQDRILWKIVSKMQVIHANCFWVSPIQLAGPKLVQN